MEEWRNGGMVGWRFAGMEVNNLPDKLVNGQFLLVNWYKPPNVRSR